VFSNLKRSTRRLLALLAMLPATVVVLGTLYMLGMTHLEGAPRTFMQGLQWASETLTTTGYGGDSRWNHPAMALFVILGQFTGQFLVFLICGSIKSLERYQGEFRASPVQSPQAG
jgi:hypothetical protein